ncbi:16S rRNA (guanine(966)-N(2))-methyltransferase RsmD [Candidatus Contubernalis alkaliaceticus]|uniref:16S rRNA (guanine(966)-N(2))-methyltransferase RsmD n=1 Tax=Candidatus Contubernalis alkaliaceticus TaxID=338645 RepID=UPI001F4C39F4|nr:16S rRNA (guanine(966)-N(2))-methyltransferase RsmD [Candidatus Contubernalis alkalaceticus]UNC92765.1 16S rRNA (guanine(966)-N(2))-methyltransferase RsmD [Candidatus Contubernalis alkalaceticus]
MRVNTGSAKGKKLKTIPGIEVRPTSDKVKGAIFNTIGQDLTDCNFLDLFSGTGGMGIEALSRGADLCVFIEKKLECVKIIYENLNITGLAQRAVVIKTDIFRGLAKLSRENMCFDFVFLDPPYFKSFYVPVLEVISEGELLKRNGSLIVEHSKQIIMPEKVFRLEQGKIKKYGDTMITYYHFTKGG